MCIATSALMIISLDYGLICIVVQTTSECAAVLEVAKTDGKNLIFKKTCG